MRYDLAFLLAQDAAIAARDLEAALPRYIDAIPTAQLRPMARAMRATALKAIAVAATLDRVATSRGAS